jgi:2-oxoisovalerate dehydrogenase E1 component
MYGPTGRPWLVHARPALLNHHTSGVRKEFYRSEEDLQAHACRDPFELFEKGHAG